MKAQLGFGDLLTAADAANERHRLDKATAHLPGSMAEAVPFYRGMIEQHHAAMLAADIGQTMAIREEAHKLAEKLHGGRTGIKAPDGAGTILQRETAAPGGAVPLWGQEGDYTLTVGPMRVRIVQRGLFGICASLGTFPEFAAHAVDWDKPFLSETGYRSFMGIGGQLVPGLTPEAFAAEIVRAHVAKALKGRLHPIKRL